MSRWHKVAVALPFVAIAVAIVDLISAWIDGRLTFDLWMTIGGMIAFTTIGGLIEVRRPGQIVGRACLTIGCLFVVSGVFNLAAGTLDARPGRVPPLGAMLAVIGNTLFSLALFASGPLLVSRFPDGREPGRLSGLLDGLLVLSGALFLMTVFRPGPIMSGSIEPIDNPIGLAGVPLLNDPGGSAIGFLAYIVTVVLAGIGLIRRYLRGTPVVRAQIRWLGASVALSLAFLAMMFVTMNSQALVGLNDIAWSAWFTSLILPPIAIGVAILRYRLYDIDRIVSNTIAYGLVTVLLFGVFVSVDLVLVSQVSPLVNNEDAVVAGCTLLVAALFNPLRTRVQRAVDRRFHRAHYDAERMVADFATRLRDELDLTTLAGDLASTTARAVEPTSTALWLRHQAAR